MRGHIWNAINGVMLVAFLFSVAVQYNDPDPIRWMLIYGAAALACFFEMRRRLLWGIPSIIGSVALIWAITILPSVSGRTHFADMFASFEMHDVVVEQAREMGGLLIVTVWMKVLFIVGMMRYRKATRAIKATEAAAA